MKSPLSGKEMKLMSEQTTLIYKEKEHNVTHHFYLCELSNLYIPESTEVRNGRDQ